MGRKLIDTSTANTVVFYKEFSNLNYTVVLQAIRPTFTGGWSPDNGYGYPINFKTSEFSIAHGAYDLDSPIQWIAQGYAA